MYQVKLASFGTSHACVIPASVLRALGWVRGDHIALFVKGKDVVLRNDTQRAARFTREWRANKDHHVQAELR